jgi:phosphomannomutase
MAKEKNSASNIFRAYDIRGVFPSDLNETTAENIGRAYAQTIAGKNVKQVLVSHDVRLSSPQLALAFIKGVAGIAGIRIAFAGMLPLGAALFHACKTDSELAYVTASHLPPEWAGMKFFHPSGAGWLENENNALHDAFRQNAAVNSPPEPEHTQILVHEEGEAAAAPHKEYIQVHKDGKFVAPRKIEHRKHTVIDPETIAANYMRHLISKIRPSRKLRVVLDCGNGAASTVAPKLFALVGFDIKALWAQPDGRFPNRSPDPHTDPLERLKEAVRSERASLGIAYDGDGDRMTIIDDNGSTLAPERTAYFILTELLKSAKGPIVANVECTRLIDDIAQRFGREVIRVPVGHTYLMDGVNTHKAAFGLEVSGHYALPALVPFDDALAISYYLACVLARQEKKLSEIVSEMPSYPFERINFICADEQKFSLIEALKQKLNQRYPNINDMDGLRIDFPDGWVLIRASNTEPKIRLTIEANNQARFDELKAEFSALLEKELKDFYKPSIFAKLRKMLKR